MKAMKLTVALVLGVVLMVAAMMMRPQPMHSQAQTPPDIPSHADHVLIKFRPAIADSIKTVNRNLVNGQLKSRVRIDPARGDLELIHFPAGLPIEQAIAVISSHPAVAYGERNWIYKHQAVSNDTYYTNGSLWGMYGDGTTPANQYGSQAGEAWAANQVGSGSVVVGVIDEGIDFNHPDLAANIWTYPFDPVDGVDNDGNGAERPIGTACEPVIPQDVPITRIS